MLFEYHVTPQLLLFMNTHPHTLFTITVAHTREIFQKLINGDLDVAYTHIPFNHPDYTCLPYRNDKMVLVTGCGNTPYRAGIHYHELENVRYITSDYEWVGLDWMLPKVNPCPLNINVMSYIIPFLEELELYCFLPYIVVQDALREGKLQEIHLLDMDIPDMTSYLIFKTAHAPHIAHWLTASQTIKSSL